MGSGPSLESEQPSLVTPGELSVVSSELEGIDLNKFLDEVLMQMRTPFGPLKIPVLKSCEVEDHGPEEFTVKTVLDGKKLHEVGFGKEDGSMMDKVDYWGRIEVDRKKKQIINKIYVGPPFGQWLDEVDPAIPVVATGYTTFVEDPLRMEYYLDMVGVGRIASDVAKGLVAGIFASTISVCKWRKVKLWCDHPGLTDPSLKSIVSEPMSPHTDYDTFWDMFMKNQRDPPQEEGKAAVKVVDLDDGGFRVCANFGEELEIWTTFYADKDIGKIKMETGLRNSKTDDKHQVGFGTAILHREPELRLEIWTEDPEGKRNTGREPLRLYQTAVDVTFARLENEASGGWGIFG